MYSISSHGKRCFVFGDSDAESGITNPQSSSSPVSVSCFPQDCSSLFSKFSLDLCTTCGYEFGFESLDVLDDVFLREYVSKCGYKFTDYFLLIVNDHKILFIEKIDSILTGLCSSFDFLRDLGQENIDIRLLMDRICASFSRCLCDLRSKCVDFLRADIIPKIIKSIFDSDLVCVISDRMVSYSEREQLFLYFVASLEKLIMIKAMKYWRYFCSENKYVLSLIPSVDYSNPLARAYVFDGTSVPNVNHPAAFTNRFGVCISFVAADEIDRMIFSFIIKCDDVLRKVIRYKCLYIYNYSDSTDSDLRKLYDSVIDKFKLLIEEEFNKKIIEDKIDNILNDFLNKLILWDNNKVVSANRTLLFKKITEYMLDLLINKSTCGARSIIGDFREGRLSFINRFSRDWRSRWGVKLHPEDSHKISFIRSKYYCKVRKFIRDKFCEMIKKEYKFLDGTVISMVDWDKISKNLLPIAQEEVKLFVIMEHQELMVFLSNVRVFDDSSVFDGSSYGTRDATVEEKDKIFRFSTELISTKNKELFIRVWKNITEEGLFESKSKRLSLNWRSKWGVRLYPEDNYEILSIRRRFEAKFARIIRNKFSAMLKEGYKFSDDTIIDFVCWDKISDNLFPVAQEMVKNLVDRECLELSRFLLNVRILGKNNIFDGSCLISRNATVEERDRIFRGSVAYIHKRNKELFGKIWNSLISEAEDNNTKQIDHFDGLLKSDSDDNCVDSMPASSVNDDVPLSAAAPTIDDEASLAVSLQSLGKVDSVINTWGLNIHPVDCRFILSIRKKFSNKVRNHLIELFSSMLENRAVLPSGRVLGSCSWASISSELSQVAIKSTESIVENQYVELGKFLSKARVVDVDKSDSSSCVVRVVTDDEKRSLMVRARKLVDKRLSDSFRFSWMYVVCRNSADTLDDYEGDCQNENLINVNGGSVIVLRYSDNIDILNTRKKYTNEIKSVAYDKFKEMMSSRYKFDDGTVIGKIGWHVASKKILPIINDEVKNIFENERIELGNILSVASVVVSDGTHRSITSEERSIVLRNVMKRVYISSKVLYRRVWNIVIELPEFEDLGEWESGGSGINLRLVDDDAIFSVRRRFSSLIGGVVRDKFIAMLNNKYKFDDGSSIGAFAWFRMSKKLLPIVKHEVSGIIKNEREELEKVISLSRVVVDRKADRELTDVEKNVVLEKVMSLVYSSSKVLFKRIWIRVINSL